MKKTCDWSELPPEIIHKISVRVDNPFDLIHFRSVCSSWRSSSVLTFQPVPSLRCPFPPDAAGIFGDDCYILRSRVYLITNLLPHTPPRFWLFKLQEKENGALALQCLLSRRTSFDGGSSHPSLSIDLLKSQVNEIAQEHVACYNYTSGCDLLGLGGTYEVEEPIGFTWLDAEKKKFVVLGRLAFEGLGMYRSFEASWTEVDKTLVSSPEGLTSFDGHLYSIVRHSGVTTVVKPTLELNSFQRSRPCDKTMRRWLVKSASKLLLVELCTENRNQYCAGREVLAEKGWFEVSELNEERNDWIQVEDVGGHVLLLYEHCSLSCLPDQIPGFRPNSLMFQLDIFGSVHLVFDIGEQSFTSFEDIHSFPSFPWVISNG